MKNMKKKVLGILAVAAALVVTGCNNNKPNPNSNSVPDSQNSQPAEQERVRVTGVTLDRNNISLKPQGYTRLKATVAPENAEDKSVYWVSSNPAIASVDNKGTVTAVRKGTATITVKSYDGGFSDTCTVVVEDKHQIKVKDDAKVKIVVDDKAEVGSVVPVKLTYDATKYVIDGVYANGVKCGTKNDEFYFVMPASGVTMETRYHEVPAKVVYKDVFTNVQGVYIQNVTAGKAQVGSSVEFTLSLDEGLELDGAVTAKAGGNDVALTKLSNNYFKFTMPNEDVEISVETKALLIPFEKTGDIVDAGYIKSTKVNGEAWTNPYIPYGATVEIELVGPGSGKYDTFFVEELCLCDQDSMYFYDQYSSLGLPLYYFANDSVEINDDGKTFTFEMPGHEIWIDFAPTPRLNDFVVEGDYYVDLVPCGYDDYYEEYYRLDEDEMGVVYNDTLYLAPAVASGYAPRKVWVESFTAYNYYFGNTSTKTITRKELTMNADGFYEFKLTERPAEPIRFTLLSKNNAELEGSDLEGAYLGAYTWGTNKNASMTTYASSDKAEILADGTMNVQGTNYVYLTYDPFSGLGYMYDPTEADPIYRQFMYKDGVFFTLKKTDMWNDVYKYVFFQKYDAEDDDALYNVVYENIDAGKTFIAECYRDGALYQTAYIDIENQIFLTGVDIYCFSGNDINDADAAYIIFYGNRQIAVISYQGNGGVANRGKVAPDALFGSYENDTGKYDELFADGFGNITLGNETGKLVSYEKATGLAVFTLDDDGSTWTVRIAEVLGTYSFVSKKESLAASFVGKTFAVDDKYYYNSSATSVRGDCNYKISFLDAKHVKVELKVGSTTYTATKANLLEKCTFSVSGNTLTVNFCPEDGNKYSSNASVTTWYFTFDENLEKLTPTSACKVPCIETDTSYLYFVPKADLVLL